MIVSMKFWLECYDLYEHVELRVKYLEVNHSLFTVPVTTVYIERSFFIASYLSKNIVPGSMIDQYMHYVLLRWI